MTVMEETFLRKESKDIGENKMKITNYKLQITNKFKIQNSKFKILVIGICILFGICVLGFGYWSFAEMKEYDGLWFLGFNMAKDIFGDKNGSLVRQAINHAINRKRIVEIIGDTNIPTGVIPIGMPGYDPELQGFPYNLSLAKSLMLKAGYPLNDKRLKVLTLLHTDGKKTIEIAKWIKRDLINLGIDLTLKEVKYEEQEAWERELSSGKYHMLLMGYKATSWGSEEAKADTVKLLYPLFHSGGSANFTFYSNSRVDELLDQLESIDISLSSMREGKLKEINRVLLEDPPTVNLFYITKL